jgi:hypothetical protein
VAVDSVDEAAESVAVAMESLVGGLGVVGSQQLQSLVPDGQRSN